MKKPEKEFREISLSGFEKKSFHAILFQLPPAENKRSQRYIMETAFIHSVREEPSFREEVYLAPNRIPFLHQDILFMAGFGVTTIYSPLKLQGSKPYWTIHHIASGEVILNQNGKKFPLKKGDFFLTRPGENNEYELFPGENKDNIAKEYIMINQGTIISLLFSQDSIPEEGIFRNVPENSRIKEYYEKIKILAVSGGENLTNTLSATTYALLLELISFGGNRRNISSELAGIVSDIRANISKRYTLDAMAARYGMGKRTLSRLFVRYLKCSPIQYVIRTRMHYAREMLLCANTKIEEVALLCGYQNFSFFSREFRKYHNVTPGEYRTKHLLSDNDSPLPLWKKRIKKKKAPLLG